MNILIVGGLLVLGIAAILGAVFLVIGEQRKENTRNQILKQETEVKSAPPAASTVPSAYRETIPPQQITDATVTRTGPKSTALTDLEGVQKLPALNGQFHELANEIRSLHQQAWQLEQRLGVLTEMVDHIEHSQDSRFNIEEEEEEQRAGSDSSVR